MNSIFWQILWKFVLIFFEGILIYNSSLDSHIEHLQVVFSLLWSHCLFVKITKCEFGWAEIGYLSHWILGREIFVDLYKITVKRKWLLLHSPKILQSFLGLSGYNRWFVHQYSTITTPLTKLLQKNSFDWSLVATSTFHQLKKVLTNIHVLILTNFDLFNLSSNLILPAQGLAESSPKMGTH